MPLDTYADRRIFKVDMKNAAAYPAYDMDQGTLLLGRMTEDEARAQYAYVRLCGDVTRLECSAAAPVFDPSTGKRTYLRVERA